MRGAFTGAVGNRQGRLEQAHKGTLFLDEVGTMSTALQMKLLRVLQEREFERVGDSHTMKVDVRVIAATNSDLGRMVADGTVSRGSVLPAERHPGAAAAAARAQGRHPAARAALSRQVQRAGRDRAGADAVTVSQEAMRRLMSYHWPGNVRQLENAIERAVAFSGGPIADRRRRSAAGAAADPEAIPLASSVDAARRRPRPRRVHREHRARADPAIARAHRRQQGPGRQAPQSEADDARREAEAAFQNLR